MSYVPAFKTWLVGFPPVAVLDRVGPVTAGGLSTKPVNEICISAPVTGGWTVTLQVSVKLPSTVVTVISVVPSVIAVTAIAKVAVDVPGVTDSETIPAVPVIVHVTFLFVASDGDIIAVRVSDSVPFIVSSRVFLSRVTPSTATLAGLTVTAQVFVLLPSAVVTVISVVPAATAVTVIAKVAVDVPGVTDSETIPAVPVMLHITFLFVAMFPASLGNTVAVRVSVGLLTIVSARELLSRVTSVTGTLKLASVSTTGGYVLVTLLYMCRTSSMTCFLEGLVNSNITS